LTCGNGGRIVPARGLDPPDREGRVGLKAGIADLFADGIRSVRFGKRCLEVSLNQMIHRQVEMRHPQPPALLWMSAQEVHGRASMRDAISGVAGPVALQRQQPVRLAERLLVTRPGRGRDRAGGIVAGAALVSQSAVHVRKPERIGAVNAGSLRRARGASCGSSTSTLS
jgi:hypothetical protein